MIDSDDQSESQRANSAHERSCFCSHILHSEVRVQIEEDASFKAYNNDCTSQHFHLDLSH